MTALDGTSAQQEGTRPDEGPDSDALRTEVNISLTEARAASTVETGGNTEEVEAVAAAAATQTTVAEVVTG